MDLLSMTKNRGQMQEFYKRSYRANFYLSSHSFEIRGFICRMEVGHKCKFSA